MFSIAHGTFTKFDHILGHKTNLNIFKRIGSHKEQNQTRN